MSNYRPAVETFPGRDTPPADLWFWFSCGVASQDRIRVARNRREYRRAWEANLDPRRRPELPAAVRTYDPAGLTHCIVFDLDCKKAGQRAAVLRDTDRVSAWLTEAGCSFFVDESPSGGRHVYVPMAEAVPLSQVAPVLKGLRAVGALATLDPSPMSNATEGCIRPPGSAHKSGGHQRLVTELHAAARSLRERSSNASWLAFTAMVPSPELTQDDVWRSVRPVHDVQRGDSQPGVARPLSPYYARIAVTGEYDHTRYGSPSQARAAVVLHAVGRGWDQAEVRKELDSGRWPGLARLYADKYGNYASTALFGRGEQVHGDIRRAQDHLIANPLHRSLTSATRPRRGLTGPAFQIYLQRWYAALQLAIADGRWATKASYGRENVLTALVSAARQVQCEQVEHGVRHLSYTGGTVLQSASVAANLRSLRIEADPFVLLVDESRGASADVYELVIPETYLDRLPPNDQLPRLPRGIHPVFGVLSAAAYRVYTALARAGRPIKAIELAEMAHAPARTVWAVLAELQTHGLSHRGGGGLWSVGRRHLDRVGREMKVGKRLRDLVRTWRLERDAWRITLGLAPREIPTTGAVAWPGREPDTTRQRPADPNTAAQAYSEMTSQQRRDYERNAIPGRAPDWRTDLELATAVLLLRHRLNATVLNAASLDDPDTPDRAGSGSASA